MKCEQVRKFIYEENADMAAMADHLRTCEKCREEFGADINLEMALQDLAAESGTIDISHDIQALIYTSKSSRSKYILWRRVIWLSVLLVSVFLFIAGLPNLLGWSKELLSIFQDLSPMVTGLDIRGLEAWARGIRNVENIKIALLIIGSIFLILSSYLWREFKQTIR